MNKKSFSVLDLQPNYNQQRCNLKYYYILPRTYAMGIHLNHPICIKRLYIYIYITLPVYLLPKVTLRVKQMQFFGGNSESNVAFWLSKKIFYFREIIM